jgi:hypothetical protein
MNMRLLDMRFLRYLVPVFILFLSVVGHAAAQDYPGFPNTIMAPAHGAAAHGRAEMSRRAARSRHRVRRNIAVARGSSGSVLPTPLPRTPLIPPEGGGAAVGRVAPQQQSPTAVPGLANPVPNLPHGQETFQDRASRCVMQQGLYGVPGGASTQYMGACLQ